MKMKRRGFIKSLLGVFAVGSSVPVSGFDNELDCLAMNIYHESRGVCYAGKLAVADVTLNRVESALYPDSVCEVVKQGDHRINWKENRVPVKHRCAFSWYCDGLSDEPTEPAAYTDARRIAETMLTSEQFRGITEGSTHYHHPDVSPDWIDDRGMRYVGEICGHEFYRWH